MRSPCWRLWCAAETFSARRPLRTAFPHETPHTPPASHFSPAAMAHSSRRAVPGVPAQKTSWHPVVARRSRCGSAFTPSCVVLLAARARCNRPLHLLAVTRTLPAAWFDLLCLRGTAYDFLYAAWDGHDASCSASPPYCCNGCMPSFCHTCLLPAEHIIIILPPHSLLRAAHWTAFCLLLIHLRLPTFSPLRLPGMTALFHLPHLAKSLYGPYLCRPRGVWFTGSWTRRFSYHALLVLCTPLAARCAVHARRRLLAKPQIALQGGHYPLTRQHLDVALATCWHKGTVATVLCHLLSLPPLLYHCSWLLHISSGCATCLHACSRTPLTFSTAAAHDNVADAGLPLASPSPCMRRLVCA